MKGIFGLNSIGLLNTKAKDLNSSLANRLMVRLDVNGSPEYRLIWKRLVMKSRPAVYVLRALPRRTHVQGFIGWQTPRASDGEKRGKINGKDKRSGLPADAQLAAWQTPQASDSKQRVSNRGMVEKRLGKRQIGLEGQAYLVAWGTPTTRDGKDSMSEGMAEENGLLARQVWSHGKRMNLFRAKGRNVGVLNPELSRWLMGFPPEWTYCGVLAMQSIRGSRKNSSKLLSKKEV